MLNDACFAEVAVEGLAYHFDAPYSYLIPEALFEDAVDVGDGHAVVDHGDACLFGGLHAVSHFLFIEHTASAMEDELVVR